MSDPRRVVVLGSNSFSGSDFIDLLLERGSFQIVGISRSPEKSGLFLPYKKRGSSAFSFHPLDLNRHMPEILDLLDAFKPQWIVNFASQSEVAPSWDRPEDWFQTNGVAFVKLVNHLKGQTTLERYLHISTPEVYGNCVGAVDSNAPMNPSTPYAISRAAQDSFLSLLRRRFGFPVVTVRSANVYGAHQQLWKIIPRSVMYALKKRTIELHGGGWARRSFIHIRDVSRGELAALEKGALGGIYHLSTETLDAVRDVVRRVCETLGRPFEEATRAVGDRPGQDSAYILDTRRSKEELGWSARIALEEGIGEVIQWIEKNWEALGSEALEYAHTP